MSASSTAAWHDVNVEQALVRLDSRAGGLSTAEAGERLALHGPNRIEAAAGRSQWRILLDQFSNVMLLMLIAVAIVAAVVAHLEQKFPKDAIAIALIVGLNGVLGYLQESKAQEALLALRELSEPIVQLLRDGSWQQLPSEQLVPGDVIRLEAGDRVPADARLLEAVDLGLREAALTGEAEVVYKQTDLVLPGETPILERRNCLFQGTEVVRGRAQAVVAATGMGTELGKIAQLIDTAGEETTPLQDRLNRLGHVLVIASLTLVGVVLLLGWLLGQPMLNLIEVSLSMAVAIVPEGLPAVITVTLAIGTQRMVRRAALIRRLPAVETLGSVTVICSDKTGTLTQNRQVVRQLRVGFEAIDLSGEGYEPTGTLSHRPLVPPEGHGQGPPSQDPGLLLAASLLCSDAMLHREADGTWQVIGDPTEGSLLVAAAKAGLDSFAVRERHPRCAEIPFSSERQSMAVWVSDPDGSLQAPLGEVARGSSQLLILKGSPEVVLSSCNRWLGPGGTAPLDPALRHWWRAQFDELAGQGLRLLALAASPHPIGPEQPLEDLVLLGVVAQMDPPRREVLQAVAVCRQAGIRPLMITGDHPLTALAIAQEVGICAAGDPVTEGSDLARLDEDQLKELLGRCSVFARVAPEQKLRLVKALQARGEIVSMTGDGVNDAPALKQAHIGVAMGITGTEVSKEAADMVLLDDNFATIVSAVEEGRLVYTNIRRFVKYILGSNVGELITIASAPLLGLTGVPLTPLQILWMNLVTDGVPALALALEPGDQLLMKRLPARPGESIFARGLGNYILRIGVIFAALTIALMALAVQQQWPWKTMVFTTLCLAQMGHALTARSDLPLVQVPPFSNPWLLLAVVFTSGLQMALIYVAPLARFFGTEWLDLEQLGVCLGFSLLLFVYLEAEKLLALLAKKRRAHL
ncbi:cation-translocating P-type ATPase [Cyanobium sp. ATX 6F1]|uniref:cation-translocating P-type ATPase n=1 Tax=Cyanobium sp. ATX 6F1 TaxID=2823702 RepID=UPI0020CC1859|nr:cation-translocating P-type ATPase [Cyanobium sp. ATX 6F1]MCP9916203.1 cation-translocating P-type ATPase [Cyanobium sp. ATX 6F1]